MSLAAPGANDGTVAGIDAGGEASRVAGGRDAALRLAGRRPLEIDEFEELAARIDAQRDERRLLERLAGLSAGEREAIELVDLMELSPVRPNLATRHLGR